MTQGFPAIDRRRFLLRGLALGAALTSFGWPRGAAAAGGKTVFVATGQKVPTILSDPDYERVYRSLFGGHALTYQLDAPRPAMLAGIMAADIVYLNVHSNKGVIVAGDGQLIDIGTLIKAYRSAGRGPSLIVVSGCNTLKIDTKVSFPRGLGIEDPSLPRAYIGFDTVVFGGFADNYFRIFFGHWLKPRADGSYRTLEEARSDATDFIDEKLKQSEANPNAGKLMKFAPMTAAIGRQLLIYGNAGLRLPDLDGATNTPPAMTDNAAPAPATTTAPASTNPSSGGSGPTMAPSSSSAGSDLTAPPPIGPKTGGASADDINKMLRE